MSRATIISYPTRATECSTYLDSNAYEGPDIILCPYRNIFRQVDLSKSYSIFAYRNRASFFLSKQRVLTSLKYQMKHSLRSSLVIGPILEKIYKFVVPMIRGFATKKNTNGSNVSESRGPLETNEHLLSALRNAHQKEPIEKIVVFDICDLPTILKFAEPLEIETLIR